MPSRQHNLAASSLVADAGAKAVLALQAAAEARKSSNSSTGTSGRGAAQADSGASRTSNGWQQAQQLTEEAVEHIRISLSAIDLQNRDLQPCLAALAPAAAELRFLTALRGQHELQASMDELFADAWATQPFPANVHSTSDGCQLSQLISGPSVTAKSAEALASAAKVSRGQRGQQLRQVAADSALQPLREPWRSAHRGRLHLLAASQLHGEGELVQALAEAAEALRHSGAAMHKSGPSENRSSGGSAPGMWQVTWQYLACLIRNGDLYEQLGAWEDALVALKEGLLMAQSIKAEALEALFSIHLADIHAKQHNFERAGALLECTEGTTLCSQQVQLRIGAHASTVRMLMSRLQGDHRGALEHCQAGVALACQALQEAEAGLIASSGPSLRCERPQKRSSNSASGSAACVEKLESSGSSVPAQHERGEEEGAPDTAAETTRLAQLYISMAECLRDDGDREGARRGLQAARDACERSAGADVPDAFPLQMAAVSHQEALLELEEAKQGGAAKDGGAHILCPRARSSQQAEGSSSRTTKPPAGRTTAKGRRAKAVPKRSGDSAAGTDATRMAVLCRLLTAWKLSRAAPSLNRRIAGALVHVISCMGLPNAAALFMHASLGAAVTAQYTAVTASRQAAAQRQAARSAASSVEPAAEAGAEAAAEAAACGRVLEALQAGCFSAGVWEAASRGQGLDLALLEAEAQAHLSERLGALPEGTPVVTLSRAPMHADSWLITRCVSGQAPQIGQIEAAEEDAVEVPEALLEESGASIHAVGENAGEELQALLEESGASMHVRKDSRAEKAAWWRTRIALDARMGHLCAGLQTRLGPWMSMVLGRPDGLTSQAAVAMIDRAQACTREASDSPPDLSTDLVELLATLIQGCDCLKDADMAAGLRQLYSAAGAELDSSQSQRLASELRTIAHEAMPGRQSAAFRALQDISNEQQPAAVPPKACPGPPKGKAHALYSLSTASEEAHSCLRSIASVLPAMQAAQQASFASAQLADGHSAVQHEVGTANQLLSIAEEEADCILRATTRRSANASTGAQASAQPASAARKQRPKEQATPQRAAICSSVSLSDTTEDDSAGSGGDVAPDNDLAQSAACRTPAPSRQLMQPRDDVEMDSPEMGAAPTPGQSGDARTEGSSVSMQVGAATPQPPMTARRKGRFAAMQTTEVPSTALRPARNAEASVSSMASRIGALGITAALPPKTPCAPVRKEPGRRKVAFVGDLSSAQTAGSQSSVRRSRAAAGRKPGMAQVKPDTDVDSIKTSHGRTSFVLHRAPLEGLDANESGLGTRFRALSLDTENDHEQQAGAPQGGGGVDAGAAGPPLPRGPVVLILDDSLQALPWESLPALRSQRVFRLPSLAIAHATTVRNSPAATPDADHASTAADSAAGRAVNAQDAVYMLNPSGDLMHTQETFQDFFQQQPGWQGSVGAPGMGGPALSEALKRRGLFVFCGHGAGQQHLGSRALRRQRSCAASLLMGCSSGRLARPGQHYEPSGPILAYLLAGCPVAVGNLWDVTDRDIDRFAMSLLKRWLQQEEHSTDSKSGSLQPKENEVQQGTAGSNEMCVSRTVSDSRGVCRLPHLIGAAPVCYGVPTCIMHAQQ